MTRPGSSKAAAVHASWASPLMPPRWASRAIPPDCPPPTLMVRSSEAEAKVFVSLGLNTSCGRVGHPTNTCDEHHAHGQQGSKPGQQHERVAAWLCDGATTQPVVAAPTCMT